MSWLKGMDESQGFNKQLHFKFLKMQKHQQPCTVSYGKTHLKPTSHSSPRKSVPHKDCSVPFAMKIFIKSNLIVACANPIIFTQSVMS